MGDDRIDGQTRQAETAQVRPRCKIPRPSMRYNGAVPTIESGLGNPAEPEVAPAATGAFGSFVAIGTA
jgi:hypothetical protein